MNRLGCCERQSESLAAKKRWTTTCTQPIQKEWIGRMIHWLCGPFCEALPRWLHWTVEPIVAVQSEYTTTKEEILPGAFSKLSINHTFYSSKARQEIAIFLWLQLSGNFLRVLPTSPMCKGTSTESLLFSAEEPKTKVKLDQIVMIPSISTLLSPWPQRKDHFATDSRMTDDCEVDYLEI